jgi:hypothetical protein
MKRSSLPGSSSEAQRFFPCFLQKQTSGLPIHTALQPMIQKAFTLRCFSLSVSGQCPLILTLCIVLMFSLSRAIGRGDLRSARISCFIAKPLRYYRSPSLAPECFGRLLLRWRTILGYYPIDPECFTKDLGGSDARLVTPSSLSGSMLSATPGSWLALVKNAPSVLPASIIGKSLF